MASKYRNIKCVFSGIKFDSKKEAARYAELAMLERVGRISGLERQVRFEVCPKVPGLKGSRARYYVADFVYDEDGKKIIEDVKSLITKKNPVYTLKKQLVQVKFPEYEFREV